MENKLFLLREIYDSLSYNLHEKAIEFFSNDKSFLVGGRGVGKTTMAYTEAVVESLLHDGKKTAIYVNVPTEKLYFDLLSIFCNDLGIFYSRNSYDSIMYFKNGSTISITNLRLRRSRGSFYDYIIADAPYLTEDNYFRILHMCNNDFKIIVGEQNEFVHNYIQSNDHIILSTNELNTAFNII